MQKLKLKYNYTNLFNIGNVLKIYYIVFFRKKKRVYSFIGFCFFKNKKNFKLINVIKKQKIILTFQENSPFLLKIFNLKMYNTYIKRVSKLYFKVKSFYKDDYNNLKTRLFSNYASIKSSFFNLAYFKSRLNVRRRRRRKFKIKFMRAERWWELLDDNFELSFSIFDIYDNLLVWFFKTEPQNFSHLEKRSFFNLYNYFFYETQFFNNNILFDSENEFFKLSNLEMLKKNSTEIELYSKESSNFEIYNFLTEIYEEFLLDDHYGPRNFSKKWIKKSHLNRVYLKKK